ncbi:hypothetical protein KBD87_00845 [Candidatus Saccharibacteria bacterium]|nr:hypothetical protein [Candidatus Saccharibacteria bacterium]
MNKTVVLLFATVFGLAGAYIPSLFGDHDMFGGWSILGSTIGGLFGIWLAFWLAKRFEW